MFDAMNFDASEESAQWDVFACAANEYFHDNARAFDCSDIDALPGFADDIEAFAGARVREAGSSESAADSEEMTLAVRAHPMYSRLVEAYYECRQIGAEGDTLEALQRERDAMLYSVQVMNEDASSSADALGVPQQDLDQFMRECTHELESYVRELHALYEDAKWCCRELESRTREVQSDVVKSTVIRGEMTESKRRAPASATEHAAASGDFDQILSNSQQRRDHEERLREDLKRKYASSIMTLKSEFMRKRKKGKLPDHSTEVLKNWWSENIVWPYPTEDDKRELIAQTKLDATQVNNWFINFRKRHWIKLFERGRQPRNAEDAARALTKAFDGSLERAKAYARSL
jgi:hypothetical protein